MWSETVEEAAFALEPSRDGTALRLTGAWVTGTVGRVDEVLRRLSPEGLGPVRIDLSGVRGFDTAGAWLLYRTRKAFEAQGHKVEIAGTDADQEQLLAVVAEHDAPMPEEPARRSITVMLLERIGRGVVSFGQDFTAIFGFFGLTLKALGRLFRNPASFRVNAFTHTVEEAGLNAVPIVTLISFLVGSVIAYQSAIQLRDFGADVFTVDLVSVSVLRELGILLTSIMVAGRSGSAYAAEIGAMKVHEEIDAMRTLALDPVEILVLPRILGLTIAVPLLNFIGDIAGLVGGMVVAWTELGITPELYLSRLQEVTRMENFMAGMIKAPVFGYLIAMVGCYEGFQVEGSAESVGRRTTRSVVEAIFIVIVVDALFSIFFVQVGI